MALALCPEVDLLISGSASVGNRGRARGTRLQQNADCTIDLKMFVLPAEKQNKTEPVERDTTFQLSPLV